VSSFGVVFLNVVMLGVGWSLVHVLVWRARWWDLGLALVLGVGVCATVVFWLTTVGARANLRTLAVAAAITATVSWLLGRRGRTPDAAPARPDPLSLVLTASLAAVVTLGVVGGFRSAPWFDDAWGIWLPKAVALIHVGLDTRLFAPSDTLVSFEVPDYPLWWSVLGALDLRAVGDVDVRALNAQAALLTAGYLFGLVRLLWDGARPWLAAGGGLLLGLSPELWRQAQGGTADLPLAMFVSLTAVCGALWILEERSEHLLLAALFASISLQIKGEAVVEVCLLLAVALTIADRRRRLLIAGLAALATTLPWLAWQWANDVPARTPLSAALDPGYLADRVERVRPATDAVVERLFDPTDWLLAVPLLVGCSIAVAIKRRSAAWLAPIAVVGLSAAFLVWAYWTNADDLDFLLATSVYRLVDPLVLTSAAITPLLVERLLRE
jgi:Dolichyl-phosphate-mannose-protein mannosyltransferase